MIKLHICEKMDTITIYCKMKFYILKLNDFNNCKTWW